MKLNMEAFEQYSLINQKRWTEFLKALEAGAHTFVFPSLDDIKSCKAIAYSLNSDKSGRFYSFNVEKREKKVVINVKPI